MDNFPQMRPMPARPQINTPSRMKQGYPDWYPKTLQGSLPPRLQAMYDGRLPSDSPRTFQRRFAPGHHEKIAAHKRKVQQQRAMADALFGEQVLRPTLQRSMPIMPELALDPYMFGN